MSAVNIESTLETGAVSGSFSVDSLVEAACSKAGVDNPAILHTPALRALSHGLACAEAELNFIGKRRARRLLIETLVKRLRVEQHLQQTPEIRDLQINAPIFLVAPARTGTTFLHRLLGQDPAHRTPRLWEALQAPPLEPLYRGDPQYFQNDYRVAIAQKYIDARARLTPDIASIHSTSVDAPEECFGLLETTLMSHSFSFYAPVSEYIDWLDQRTDEEWVDCYRQYANQLRLLQWWSPGERWVLKTPFHMWAPDAILSVFPDALIVQQHRDPIECTASYCSLMASAYGPISVRVDGCSIDRNRIGRIAIDYLRDALARNVEARRRLPPERFIDIEYRDLMSDPLGSVRKVYLAAGGTLAPDAEKQLAAWLEQQSAIRGGGESHLYSLADYGIDPDEVEEAFAEYSQYLEQDQRTQYGRS
jgi:hypothetical protein